MRTTWREIIIFAIIAASIPLIIMLLIKLTPLPPISDMDHARQVISQAGKDRADTYSKRLYSEAKTYYDSAMVNWHRQNSRFLYFRDYERVSMYAILAAEKAKSAAENSIGSSKSLNIRVKQKIDILNDLVEEINKLFATYPLTSETRNRISEGKMFLKEAEILYNKSQFLQANRKITDSEYLLTNSFENATANLNEYFKLYPTWEEWVAKTINESRINRDYSIIIDKFSRKFFVYQSGKIKWEFDAELGKNWVGDKRVKGDKATPEGMYKITKKAEGKTTKYYKALLLDYPNDEDKQKFKKEIADGSLPASANIGNLIEIHGKGGKGIDWTDGCVALTDKEMDLIFKIVKVGTPVTIVGSMAQLDKIKNR